MRRPGEIVMRDQHGEVEVGDLTMSPLVEQEEEAHDEHDAESMFLYFP
jgi:hypothetical protein